MESSKFNPSKILLSSFAFGAASFGIGMLMNHELGKALTTGAIGLTAAGATGVLIGGGKKEEDNNLSGDFHTKIQELQAQEKQLQESILEKTSKRDEVEVGINSLHTEHQQLVEEISHLNSQKQKLETEYNTWQTKVEESEQKQQTLDQDLLSLETRKQELKQEQEDLNQSLTSLQEQTQELEATLTTKQAELEQTISQVSQAQPQAVAIEEESNNSQSPIEEFAKPEEQTNQSLAADDVYVESIEQLSVQEAESSVSNLNDDEAEEFSKETSADLDLEFSNADVKEFSEETPFGLDIAEPLVEDESSDTNSELENLMGNLTDADMEQFSEETPFGLDVSEPLAEDESFDTDSELENLMGNLTDADMEQFGEETPFGLDLELGETMENIPSSEELNDSEISDEDPIDEKLEQLDGLISSIAGASADLDDLNNLFGSSDNQKLANGED